MEDKALQAFNFDSQKIRVVVKDSEPWWVAADVCGVLEISETHRAIAGLDEDEKGRQKMTTPGGEQEMSIISESGLYTLIMRSNKPEAKRFRKWVTAEVLPAIRKTGAYAAPAKLEELLADPDAWIRTLTELKKEREEKAALEAKIERDAPKLALYETVMASGEAIDMQETAAVLRFQKMGRGNLFKFLRDKKILIKNNIPYRGCIERGFFRIVEQPYTKNDGTSGVYVKTLVLPRGLAHIRRRLLEAGYAPIEKMTGMQLPW